MVTLGRSIDSKQHKQIIVFCVLQEDVKTKHWNKLLDFMENI